MKGYKRIMREYLLSRGFEAVKTHRVPDLGYVTAARLEGTDKFKRNKIYLVNGRLAPYADSFLDDFIEAKRNHKPWSIRDKPLFELEYRLPYEGREIRTITRGYLTEPFLEIEIVKP